MNETQYTIFTVKYEFKHGKRAWAAYQGDDRNVYEEMIEKTRQRTDIARMYASETHTTVTEFEIEE